MTRFLTLASLYTCPSSTAATTMRTTGSNTRCGSPTQPHACNNDCRQ